MDKIATLQKRAALVGRTLFASLPFHVRLAYVFSILANTDLQALGRALGAIFIKKKVRGLPDVHGKPALDWPANKPLPPDYLKGLASDLRRFLLAKFHDEHLVDTTIDNWLFRFVVEGGWEHMIEGITLKEAQNYAFTGLLRQGLNEITVKKRERGRNRSLNETDEEGHVVFEPADPSAAKNIYENLPSTKMPSVRRILENKVHPDAPLYLDLLLDGYEGTEILGDPNKGRIPMLPYLQHHPLSYANWKKTYEPKILQVLKEFAHPDAL